MNDVLCYVEMIFDAIYFSQAVKFAKCLAEEIPDISLKYNITAVPTFVLLRKGAAVQRVDGANAGDLTKKINQAVTKPNLASF